MYFGVEYGKAKKFVLFCEYSTSRNCVDCNEWPKVQMAIKYLILGIFQNLILHGN